MDSHITKTLGDFATRLTGMEHNFNALTTRMCKFETGAASGSSGPDSARSWNTFRPKIITEMRGADLIVFELI